MKFALSIMRFAVLIAGALAIFLSAAAAQPTTKIPDWCKALPRPEYKSLERVPSPGPWFEIYKVAPQTFAIYEPHQFEETISYLIVGQKKAILFDTGMGIGDLRQVVSSLTPLPVMVLNSHTHNDHVGDNWQFDSIYSVDTGFSRRDAAGSSEDAQQEILAGEICGDLPPGFDGAAYKTKPWHIAGYLRDGQKFDLGGRMIEVLLTPGHTPDGVTLFDRGNGLLFTGDVYYPAPIWLYRPETDFNAYDTSIKRLAALAPRIKVVLGAHNVPVASPSVLPALLAAFTALVNGKSQCHQVSGTQRQCTTGGITFLLSMAPLELH